MGFPGDRSIKNLRLLLVELRATHQRITGKAIMRTDASEKSPAVLMRKIAVLIDKIYEGTDDNHLKAVVNSVFDSISVADTIIELRGLNNGHKPQWYISLDDN